MRLVTWNMDHWRRSADQRTDAWAYLETTLAPDVALVQEAVPPSHLQSVFRAGGIDDRRGAPTNRGWGSAVVSFGPAITAVETATEPYRKKVVPVLRTFPGSVAIAEVKIDNDSIIVISMYGVIDRGYANATVHRMLSDLEPLVDQRRGEKILIAGDLNVTTQWSEHHRKSLRGRHAELLRREQNLFERFAVLGFRNLVVGSAPLEGCACSFGESCRHVRTQRHESSDFPWMNDYVFATEDLHASIQVIDDDNSRRLSSHFPVVVQL